MNYIILSLSLRLLLLPSSASFPFSSRDIFITYFFHPFLRHYFLFTRYTISSFFFFFFHYVGFSSLLISAISFSSPSFFIVFILSYHIQNCFEPSKLFSYWTTIHIFIFHWLLFSFIHPWTEPYNNVNWFSSCLLNLHYSSFHPSLVHWFRLLNTNYPGILLSISYMSSPSFIWLFHIIFHFIEFINTLFAININSHCRSLPITVS